MPEELQQVLQVLSGNVVERLRNRVAVKPEDAAPRSPPTSALRSPLLRPLSPPPVDDEVRDLERQLDEASQRVAQLRASMQAKLQERLAEQLAAARPTAEPKPPAADSDAAQAGEQHGEEQAATAGADAGAEPTIALPAPFSPQTEELQQRLAAAAGKLPLLRARLEEATGRLGRTMGVAEGMLDGPPPNTVEKAMLGKTPAPPQQGEDGAARDVQPLPCAALAPGAGAD